ncbi:hypothetical protein [Thermostichus vulcanus]|uniref:S1 motif domain-containing protein n=1 Tax=Thermostichus vulcanus str. 'Rupite' TaxID=2813851 RepID=A0ABT0C9D6_THEVL|nr:hypothetical protein [Thermostichus vulcanus]MCJ2542403.1 hypothetical protein [Thermostichus vulcanus str. 'Rupite']
MANTPLLESVDLSPQSWDLAHSIAMTLVKANTDVNELSKVTAYLRSVAHHPDAGSRFFKFMSELVRERRLHRTKQTEGYYRSIEEICKDYLESLKDNPAQMLQILGWAARLMRYYKDGGMPLGEIPPPPGSQLNSDSERPVEEQAQRLAEIAEVRDNTQFRVGQKLDATVANINGNRVTYEILGTIRLTQKEPKRAGSLSVGQVVQVAITDLKDDGGIRRISLL